MGLTSLKGRIPKIASAMSPRIIWIGSALGVVLLVVVVYGFRYRFQQREEQRAAYSAQNTVVDAAVSTRKDLHGRLTPLDNLEEPSPVQTAANNVAQGAKGVVRAVAQPWGNNEQQQLANYPSQPPAEDPIEQRRRRAYERRMAAIESPTGVAVNASPEVKPTDSLAELAKLANNAAPPAATASDKHDGFASDDPNGQENKRAFQKEASDNDYIKATRIAPLSPWVVERGDSIEAGLPNKLVTDLPGDLIAEVKRDVYDSPTHRYLMIPAGSLLAGEYNSSVSYGQQRAQVVWTYLRFPDGTYVDLEKFISHSADGAVGLKDQVDNHLKRLIGGIALTSGFAAGIQISQNRSGGNSTFTYPSNTQLAASAAGQQAASLGENLTSRNLNLQPTIKIRPGNNFAVSVMKTIIFPGPYKPLQANARKVVLQ
ncbi:MAG TPA: TrbI/VirB10 family protein [Bryobacteraceae bacterium]|nr:TrbI/VirB10 family protein [Bryobacteraceae bacterium]